MTLKLRELERAVESTFASTRMDVFVIGKLEHSDADRCMAYFPKKGYKTVGGAVADAQTFDDPVYEVHIWRKR